ncbi:MAG: polyamine aminopropyltransferase [Acidobacteriota bacterium]
MTRGVFQEIAATRGFYDGRWLTEEDAETSRLSLRIRRRLHHEVSAYQEIAVYESHFFGRVLTLDNILMLTERDEFVYHEMMVHVPLCSLPAPRSVLIIGGGDCGCLREVLRHAEVERVVQCELDERVTRVCEKWFAWVPPALADPRVELVFHDGVRYIRDLKEFFDLVIVDSTDPVGPALQLFQADFYRQVAAVLKPDGVMTAQTGSPHWSAPLVGAIHDEQRRAFRHVAAYIGCIPTYQGGTWCWSYASRERRPMDFLAEDRITALEPDCRYYNAAIHRAAFALPTFARQAAAGQASVRPRSRAAPGTAPRGE